MSYSQQGVNLVAAVMGILEGGRHLFRHRTLLRVGLGGAVPWCKKLVSWSAIIMYAIEER